MRHGSILLVFWFTVMFASSLGSQESQLIDFKIKDQFNQEHTDEDYRGSIVVLLGSDKGGAPFNDRWGRAIRQAMAGEPGFEKVVFLPYADVRGVPFFLKGVVRGKFPKEEEKWVLVDWKGRIAKAYRFQSDASNIVIFDRDGTLALHVHGREVEETTLDEIAAKLRELLGAN